MPLDYIPPSGWSILGSALITAENQKEYGYFSLAECGFKSLAVLMSADDNMPRYAPPLGWTVYIIERPAGTSFDQLFDQNSIWVDPDGNVYDINACSQSRIYGAGATGSQPPQGALWWPLLIGAGLMFWAFTSKEGG
jgi:hypothetical protein